MTLRTLEDVLPKDQAKRWAEWAADLDTCLAIYPERLERADSTCWARLCFGTVIPSASDGPEPTGG